MDHKVNFLWGAVALCASAFLSVVNTSAQDRQIESWVTLQDRSALFAKQPEKTSFTHTTRGYSQPIIIDEQQQFQSVDGFGFALTGGSAQHLHAMSPEARTQILKECFGTGEGQVGFSYLRISIGSSDLNSVVYSYDDLPDGETDFELKSFALGHDYDDVIPVLKEILAINPDIPILGSPWSAPTWMKTNGKVRGGSLKEECYDVYARYFVKYIQAMATEGIKLDAITIQNEPLNSNNTPSMVMRDVEQQTFLKKHLGPLFKQNRITTKVILFDHNCDRPDYALNILSDPEAAQYANGVGYHHYGGNISAMSLIHQAHPEKHLYFTEQMVVENPQSKTIAIANQVHRLIIDCTRNWSRNVILWNLAADRNNDPHTDNGGCTMCQGALTIDGDNVSRNLAYYVIAHASKLVPPGSVRIGSTAPTDNSISLTRDEERPEVKRYAITTASNVLPNVAFKTPEGKIVLIVANNTATPSELKIQYNGKFATFRISPGMVGTYIW